METQPELIKLDCIVQAEHNPRRIADDARVAELADSISRDGLLQNLVVRKKPRTKSKYVIISGSRRLAALQRLVERGNISPDYGVACKVVTHKKGTTPSEDLRLALIENVQREDLTPLEESDAYHELLAKGQDIHDLVAKTGKSLAVIKRRLMLQQLIDFNRALLESGTLSITQAEQLALGTEGQQLEYGRQIDGGSNITARALRQIMTEGRPSRAIAIFDPEDYTGTITTDLLGEDETSYFDDVKQFHKLQRRAFRDRVMELREQFGKCEAYERHDFPTEDWEKAPKGEKGIAVIVLLPDGKVIERTGLVPASPAPQTAAELQEHPAREKITGGEITTAPEAATVDGVEIEAGDKILHKDGDDHDDADEKAGSGKTTDLSYTTTAAEYCAKWRGLATIHAMLKNPRVARIYNICQLMSASGRCAPSLSYFAELEKPPAVYAMIEAEAKRWTDWMIDLGLIDGYNNHLNGQTMPAWETLISAWPDSGHLFNALTNICDEELVDLQNLISTLQVAYSPQFAQFSDGMNAARELEVNMRDYWDPDEAFLKKRKRAQLAALALQAGAVETDELAASLGKSDLVTLLAEFFAAPQHPAGTEDMTAEQEEFARTYLPGPMSFPPVFDRDHLPGAAPTSAGADDPASQKQAETSEAA